jgi:capsular exopolysaccharide synthesis family protein
MSKFFNETLKTQNPNLPQQGFNLAGLQELETTDEQIDAKALEPDPVQPQVDQTNRIEIPESMLLATRFQGSHSLQSAEEAYRALRTRLFRLSSTRDLRSIIVTSSVAGEGKTLTSFNLALCCSQLNEMRVLLIDGDIRTAGLTRSLVSAPSKGLADILLGQCGPESVVCETNHPNLYVCGAGTTTHSPGELYAGRRWQEFIAWCKESFHLVLVDSPPIMTLSDVELMTAACDGVLLAVRARHTRRDVLQRFATQIDAKKLLGIVYNFSEGPHHKYNYSGKKER